MKGVKPEFYGLSGVAVRATNCGGCGEKRSGIHTLDIPTGRYYNTRRLFLEVDG